MTCQLKINKAEVELFEKGARECEGLSEPDVDQERRIEVSRFSSVRIHNSDRLHLSSDNRLKATLNMILLQLNTYTGGHID